MYAVIETGGKQYRVTPGELIQIEKIPGEVGDQLDLDQVLLISPDDGEMIVGRPMIEGARVIGSNSLFRSSSAGNDIVPGPVTVKNTGKYASRRYGCRATRLKQKLKLKKRQNSRLRLLKSHPTAQRPR